MSAKREDLEVMRCVDCNTVKAWRDGFPNRCDALCWDCAWGRHIEQSHKWLAGKARRKARRRARRIIVRDEHDKAMRLLRDNLIEKP